MDPEHRQPLRPAGIPGKRKTSLHNCNKLDWLFCKVLAMRVLEWFAGWGIYLGSLRGLFQVSAWAECFRQSNAAACCITRREAILASAVSWGTKRGLPFPLARPGQATAAPGRRPRVAALAFREASSGCSGCIDRQAGRTAAGSMRVSLVKPILFSRPHQPTLRRAYRISTRGPWYR